MKRVFLVLTVLLLLVGCSDVRGTSEAHGKPAIANPPSDGTQVFSTDLTGEDEVPPLDSDFSGRVQLFYKPDTATMAFNLFLRQGFGVTQCHIHCGPDGVRGNVVLYFSGFNAAGMDSGNGLFASGIFTDQSVSSNFATVVTPVACFDPAGVMTQVFTLADVVAQIQAGNAYAECHTTAFPRGEIRGQLK